jgi:hypothetical protein
MLALILYHQPIGPNIPVWVQSTLMHPVTFVLVLMCVVFLPITLAILVIRRYWNTDMDKYRNNRRVLTYQEITRNYSQGETQDNTLPGKDRPNQ